MSANTATIHIDGAARGNPGPAACAYVISRPGSGTVERADLLGTATNNVAEYTALLRALTCASQLGLRRLDVHSDSELLVKQINGEYRVKNLDLKEFYDEAIDLMRRFDVVHVNHVRREANRRADQLCNEALDGQPARRADRAAPNRASQATTRRASTAEIRQRVDDDAVTCLRGAISAWRNGGQGPAAEQVWDQLWSILEAAAVLKVPRGGR